MNQFLRVSAAAFVGTTLMLASMSSHALGFGRPTSQAILGESLTLTVPLRLEAGEEVKDECVSAEVLFGDERVAASAVNVSLLSSGAERRLRVTTSALVNRAHCHHQPESRLRRKHHAQVCGAGRPA